MTNKAKFWTAFSALLVYAAFVFWFVATHAHMNNWELGGLLIGLSVLGVLVNTRLEAMQKERKGIRDDN
jgi:hypothetical protein